MANGAKLWKGANQPPKEEKKTAKKRTLSKHRYFTFLLYLDSSPDDRIDKLESLGLPMAISPLHDLDEREVKSEDMSESEKKTVANGGKLYKKPHYHVIYVSANPVTVDSVRKKIQRKLGSKSVALVQVVDNIKNCFDYLSHDSKDAIKKHKHKYSKSDIKLLNNFDISRYEVKDENQKAEIFDRICKAVFDNHIMNMHQLIDYFQKHEDYGIKGYAAVNAVLGNKSGLLRLYMDGEYQQYQLYKDKYKQPNGE